MGRHRIPEGDILANPLRRAILLHLVTAGGHSSMMELNRALGIVHRGSTRWACDLLLRDGLIRRHMVGSGDVRASVITITKAGRAAIAGDVKSPQALEMSA
jgi:hypothetical protein